MFLKNDRRMVSVQNNNRAVALASGPIIIYPDQNFADLIDTEPEPDVLEDLLPGEASDWRTLEYVFEKNPDLFAKFIAERWSAR